MVAVVAVAESSGLSASMDEDQSRLRRRLRQHAQDKLEGGAHKVASRGSDECCWH